MWNSVVNVSVVVCCILPLTVIFLQPPRFWLHNETWKNEKWITMVVTRNQQGLKSAYRSEVLKLRCRPFSHSNIITRYSFWIIRKKLIQFITVKLYTEVHLKNVLNIFKMRVGKIAKLWKSLIQILCTHTCTVPTSFSLRVLCGSECL